MIKTEEEGSIKKWKQIEKGLNGKPERESGNKIVVSQERIYAKSGNANRAGSKPKPKSSKNCGSTKGKENQSPRTPAPSKNKRRHFDQPRYPQYHQNPPQPVVNYQQQHMNYNQPRVVTLICDKNKLYL